MQNVTSYTEELLNSFMKFSNTDLDVEGYLSIRRQALSELTNVRLNQTDSQIQIENTRRHPKDQLSKNETTIAQGDVSINTNMNTSITKPTLKPETISTSKAVSTSESNSFWDAINKIED